MHLRKDILAPIQNCGSAREVEVTQHCGVRQVGQRSVVELDYLADIDWGIFDRFAVAVNSVCGMQIGKPEALELGRDRLWIVHDRRNEVVQVEIFYVEDLPKVGAALNQESSHDLLLMHWIEAGPNRLWDH